MQRKKAKGSLQNNRRDHGARARRRLQLIREPKKKAPNPEKVIANGLFALRLRERHGIEIYPHLGGKFMWEDVDPVEKILDDIVPGYLKTMDLLDLIPIEIDYRDHWMPKKLLADLNQYMVSSGEVVRLFKDDSIYKLIHVEELPTNECFNVLGYKEVRQKLKGKYIGLYHRAMHSLLFVLRIGDWDASYDYHFDAMDWEETYDGDDEALNEHATIRYKYENGEAKNAIAIIKTSKPLTENFLSRYVHDNHPVVSFARDVFELANSGKELSMFSKQIDDSLYGSELHYYDQFLVNYDHDQVFEYYTEWIDNMANEGIQTPTLITELNSDMTSLPELGKEDFTFKLYKLFDKHSGLNYKIDNIHLLSNILLPEVEVECRIRV